MSPDSFVAGGGKLPGERIDLAQKLFFIRRPRHGQPFEPMARLKVYRSTRPASSGPEIAAVAISGYAAVSSSRTCSTGIEGFGSGILVPL